MPASFAIHPEDEMRLFLRSLGRPEDALVCEYMQTGYAVFAMIREVLRRFDRRLDRVASLLDFASGYGRVVRFLLDEVPRERVTIADIYPDAVRFQREELGVHGLVSATEPDGVQLGGPHDLITSISLFSHLPEALFDRWLVHLAGALSPDGLFVFTTHGPHLLAPDFTGDFAFEPRSESRTLAKETYGSTFVSRAWVERRVRDLLPGRHVVAFFPRASNRHQDVHVVGPTSLAPCARTDLTLPLVFVDGMVREGDRARLWGWALCETDGTPARRLRAFVDHAEVGTFDPGEERLDVPQLHPGASTRAGFAGTFAYAYWMARRLFSLEAEDEHGVRARVFHQMPF